MPLVSVLTTSYNHGRWLPDTLRSVDVQTYPRVEHIVVDDGSTDDSIAVLSSWPGSRLLWDSSPPTSQAANVNAAYRLSKGDIIGWLSSDDVYYDSQAVASAVRAFQAHPEVALVYGHAVLIGADGLQLQTEWVPPALLARWTPAMRIVQPAVFLRRTVLGSRLVDESFDIAIDTELWLRLKSAHRFLRLGRVLAAERHHASRRSYAMTDVTRQEGERLDEMYGSGKGASARRRNAVRGIIYRWLGASLVPRISHTPDAFAGHLDSRRNLLKRQLLVRRSRMQKEEV
jgi:glycosyltransferase involved in cell wall biosynthesis